MAITARHRARAYCPQLGRSTFSQTSSRGSSRHLVYGTSTSSGPHT